MAQRRTNFAFGHTNSFLCVKKSQTAKQTGSNEGYERKDKGEEKLINCQRVLGFAECIHQYRDSTPFCLWGQEKWKMLVIFPSANHRPKPPFEVININLSWASFKQNKNYGFSSSVLHNKLISSGTKRRTNQRRQQWLIAIKSSGIRIRHRTISDIICSCGFQRPGCVLCTVILEQVWAPWNKIEHMQLYSFFTWDYDLIWWRQRGQDESFEGHLCWDLGDFGYLLTQGMLCAGQKVRSTAHKRIVNSNILYQPITNLE